jgi:hypothetical protein
MPVEFVAKNWPRSIDLFISQSAIYGQTQKFHVWTCAVSSLSSDVSHVIQKSTHDAGFFYGLADEGRDARTYLAIILVFEAKKSIEGCVGHEQRDESL